MDSLSKRRRIWFFCTGVLLPAACIAYALAGGAVSASPLWQSGALWVYASLILGNPALTALLPLMLFSMTCLTLVTVSPRLGKHLLLRAGIYAGVPLSIAILATTVVATGIITLVIACIVGFLFGVGLFLTAELVSNWRRFSILQLMIVTAAVAFITAMASYVHWEKNLYMLTWSVFMFVIASAPTLNAVTYIHASLWLYRATAAVATTYVRFAWACFSVGWLTAALYSWRVAVEMALEEYARLPANPNCYVSSAAANGHRWLVGTNQVPPGLPVNLQMKRLKALEACCLTAVPGCHAKLRWTYDRVGPSLAVVCRVHRCFADFTYLMLKPWEWMAIVVCRLAQVSDSRIYEIYEANGQDPPMARESVGSGLF